MYETFIVSIAFSDANTIDTLNDSIVHFKVPMVECENALEIDQKYQV
jgi:hypothetical protein